MNEHIEKLVDETIMESKRFQQQHKPPAPMTDIERFKTKLRHIKSWFWRNIGLAPDDLETIESMINDRGPTRGGDKGAMRRGGVYETKITVTETKVKER